MILTRTPFRISFLGGGTDFPSWYLKHGGSVLGTTIDKYCHLSCRYMPPFFDYKYRIVWSHLEVVKEIDEILHPVIPKALKSVGIEEGLEIHHIGDLPARSGVGSSSSFIVGLLHGLYALKGKMISKTELLERSLDLEQNILKERVGSQDQTLAVYGGLNKIDFMENGIIKVSPITISADRLQHFNDHLMLFFTGISRFSSKIQEKTVASIHNHDPLLKEMQTLVDQGVDVLSRSQNLFEFGELLNENWNIKQHINPSASTDAIQEIYSAARAAGATGGKILGAGGGGFMLLFVPPRFQHKVRERLRKLVYVPFKFEHAGSQIIHYDVESKTLQAIQDFNRYKEEQQALSLI